MARPKNKPEEQTTVVACRLPIPEAARLRAQAGRAGVPVGEFLRELTRQGLSRVEQKQEGEPRR